MGTQQDQQDLQRLSYRVRYKEGEGRKGRQKKRWGDNMSEWTELGLGGVLRKDEDREEWRKVAARSSLMPQRSFRVREE